MARPIGRVECGSVVWRYGDRQRVTAIVKATFGMVHEGDARLLAPQAICREDRARGPEPASSLIAAAETAPALRGAGVVLSGHARAPGGRAVPALTVQLAIYRGRPVLEKVIHVFGDRSGGAPAPFVAIPLIWERAYGGPGVEDNPAGSSAAPNLIHPADPRRPAAMGPIPKSWPARRRWMGPLDPRALEKETPELPAGVDFRSLHAAPRDQQVDALHGEEWIVLDGMSAAHPRLRTRLPSVRGRAKWYSNSDGQMRDLELLADTLTIDADLQVLSVVWRGSFEAPDAEAVARARIFGGVEMPGAPIEWPEAESGGGGMTAKISVADVVSRMQRSMGGAPVSAAMTAGPAQPSGPALPFAQAAKGVEGAAGMPRVNKAPDELASTGKIDLAAVAARVLPFAGGEAKAAPGSLFAVGGEAAPAPVRAEVTRSPQNVSELVAGGGPTGAEAVRARANVPSRRVIQAKLLAGESFAGADLAGADLHELDLGGRHLEGADLSGCDLERARLVGAFLSGAKLERARLVGADLTDASLRDVRGEDARFDRAVLTGADFTGASLPRASFVGASARRAVMARASFHRAAFNEIDAGGADFTGAALDGADLARAALEDARLDEARAEGAIFDDARLTGARAEGAKLVGCSLRNATANGAMMDGASLVRSVLDGAKLARASLLRAQIGGASFVGADLRESRLQCAAGEEARFDGAALDGADLRRANLPEASFERAGLARVNLEKASLVGARLGRADLGRAILRKVDLRGADLRDAKLERTDLREADLRGARLPEAGLSAAKTRGARTDDGGEAAAGAEGG